MKKILCMAFFAITILSAVSYAAEMSSDEASAALKKAYPALQFQSVSKSPVDGLWEVVAGQNILYFYPKNDTVLIGEMFDKGGKNLTSTARDKVSSSMLKDIPLDKAIKVGSGTHQVIMFTDLDCPYCRKTEAFFKDRKDVTRYIFFTPLENIHPKSMAKSLEVMCSKNRSKAFLAAAAGSLDKTDLKGCSDDNAKLALSEQVSIGKKVGVRGTPFLFVDGVPVRGADTNRIESLLSGTNK